MQQGPGSIKRHRYYRAVIACFYLGVEHPVIIIVYSILQPESADEGHTKLYSSLEYEQHRQSDMHEILKGSTTARETSGTNHVSAVAKGLGNILLRCTLYLTSPCCILPWLWRCWLMSPSRHHTQCGQCALADLSIQRWYGVARQPAPAKCLSVSLSFLPSHLNQLPSAYCTFQPS
jgi:hypothetical protein